MLIDNINYKQMLPNFDSKLLSDLTNEYIYIYIYISHLRYFL